MTQTTNNLKPLTREQVEGARHALNTVPELVAAVKALPADGSRSAALVKLLMSIGFTAIEAIQIALGHDAAQKIASAVYHDLRARSAKATA